MRKRKKNYHTLELEIESLGFEGVSIARKDGKVYLLKGGLPGEKVIAVVTESKKNYCEGYVKEILVASYDRIEARCKYFGTCGGCSWQDLPYSMQLNWKKQHVEDAFNRIGKFEYSNLHNVLPANEIFNYRNKMEFSFGSVRWLTPFEINTEEEINKYFALGLHFPGKYDRIIDIRNCHLQPEIGDSILDFVRNKAIADNINAYNYNKHSGFLKNLVLRYSKFEGRLMAILITSPPENQVEDDFGRWFVSQLPKEFASIKSAAYVNTDKQNPVAAGKIIEHSGTLELIEKVLDVEFKISPFSFFQTNSGQLDSFIGNIIAFAELLPTDIVWDLYCGCGSIALPITRKAKKVIGIELVVSAIEDAKSNAKADMIDNAEFYQADLHSKYAPELLDSLPKPDIIILDPPRSGIVQNLINHILNFLPNRIVYVSCNPATQARDLSIFAEYYSIEEVLPVDMFPQTYHIETIVKLKRKEAE